jgi:HlyD family secretion protein
METELRNLRIEREARRSREGNPLVKWGVIAALVVAVTTAGLFAYSKLTAPLPVKVVRVQSPVAASAAGEQTILTATGYIVAAHKIEVASKVVGRVAWIGVEKADKVKAGQVLVRLEDDEYRAQLQQQKGQLTNLQARLAELEHGSRPEEIAKARADVNQAHADLENYKITLDRTRALANDGVMAKQALDDAQARYDGALAKVNSLQRTLDLAVLGPRREQMDQVRGQIMQAQGAVAYAQTQLENTLIKAPVTGTILDRNVEKGEFVTNGFVGDRGAKGYIVTMADLNDLKVELDISQNDFPKLGPHQKGTITTDAYPDRKYQGQIDEVSPQADRSKATVQVKVRVLNPDDYLRPDMNATVNFYNDAKPAQGEEQGKRVVIIPRAGVQNGSVFIAFNGRAKKIPVTVGGATGEGVVVESGLIGGEDLIVGAPADLKDGQRVKLQ